MLNISFEPPLRSETRVRPAIQGDATIKITFHATLDSSEWHSIEQQDSSIQLWSDIATEGRRAGEWGATNFVRSGPESDTISLEASLVTLSSQGSNSPRRFSYTFRVRHSSGAIQWLGSTNSNGHIILDSEPFWSPSEDSASFVIGTLNRVTQWRGWLLSTDRAPVMFNPLSLNGDEPSPAVQVLLLSPENPQRKPSQPPSLVLHSASGPITVHHGKVHCETPKDVTVEIIFKDKSIAEVLQTHGISSIPTSENDAFFVYAPERMSGQTALSCYPIWLSSRVPTTVKVSASDIQAITGSSTVTVIYPPGQGISSPVLLKDGKHEVPLANGSEPLRVVPLQAVPNSEGQLVGVATPSKVPQVHSPASLDSPTLTAVDTIATAATKATKATTTTTTAAAAAPKDGGKKKLATVTVSKSSNVLFSRTMAVPAIISFQIERLLRFKLLYAFYRLALYITSLVMPFLGINLSLKLSPQHEAEKSGPGHEPGTRTREEERETEFGTHETREVPTTDSSLYYDVEPVNGEVHVAFLGEAVDEVLFTVNENKVDPWSIVQTWHGDDLHQFLLKMDVPSRLGISIQPTSPE